MVGSAWVFDQFFHREPTRKYRTELIKLSTIYDVRQVVCYAPPAEMLRRLSYNGETDWRLRDLATVQELFLRWHEAASTFIPSLLANTSDAVGIREAAENVEQWIRSSTETHERPMIGTLRSSS